MDLPSKRSTTRLKLYEQIWKRPTILIARDFGLSDVGLAKLCKRNGIPKPPRGYWAMLQVGKAPPREELPMPGRDWEIEIPGPSGGGDSGGPTAITDSASEKKPADVQVPVAETLYHAHPIVKASMPLLRVASCNEYGLIVPVPGCACVSVSRSRLRRALLIMDALIRCFERLGYTVTCPVEEDRLCQTRVELMGVGVPFRIDEFLLEKSDGQTATSCSKQSYRLHRPHGYGKVNPSGRLQLSIDEDRCKWCVRWNGFRLKWSDGKSQRVEDLLGDFVAETVRVACFMKTKREESEKRERERQIEEDRKAEAERRRQAMVERINEERRRVDELMEEADDWSESRKLRQYIEAVRQSALERGEDVGTDSVPGKWLAWASQQADRLDPLTASPHSVLDDADKFKEERPVIFGGYGVGAATQYQDETQKKSEFFRKRWLYDRFRGQSR